MSMTVREIESAIEQLAPSEVSKLSEWFAEFEAQIWDRKIEGDLRNGKFRNLIEETKRDFAKENYRLS